MPAPWNSSIPYLQGGVLVVMQKVILGETRLTSRDHGSARFSKKTSLSILSHSHPLLFQSPCLLVAPCYTINLWTIGLWQELLILQRSSGFGLASSFRQPWNAPLGSDSRDRLGGWKWRRLGHWMMGKFTGNPDIWWLKHVKTMVPCGFSQKYQSIHLGNCWGKLMNHGRDGFTQNIPRPLTRSN